MRNVATTGKRIGYGWLYNWYAVNHASGLAPDGWRVPTQQDWRDMVSYIVDEYVDVNNDNVGGALKSTKNEWNSPNTNATDMFRFAALPGGRRDALGAFGFLNDVVNYWTSTETTSPYAVARGISYDGAILTEQSFIDKERGYSVRCIQDKSVGETDGDTGTLTDIDGNTYTWVVIGDHRWMAENLRTTKYKNGSTIPEITDNTSWANDTTGARCAYNNDHYFVYPPQK